MSGLKMLLLTVAMIAAGSISHAFEIKQIVIPDNPSPVEEYAAQTLAKYFKLVFKKNFPIVKSAVLPEKGSCCVGPELAAKGLKNLPALADEESIAKSHDGRLFLTGNKNDSRGTLYAVYELLEQTLGIRSAYAFIRPLPKKCLSARALISAKLISVLRRSFPSAETFSA